MVQATYLMVLDEYISAHRRILEFAETLTEEELTWHTAPGQLNIAFFLWHVGRWADHIQAATPGMTPVLTQRLPPGRQVWDDLFGMMQMLLGQQK
jgi:hypothetical protein